jgi:hypothetical protein
LGNLAEEFDKSWQEESRRHAATTIRNEVDDWCESYRSTAEKRWLYELLQNAIDTATENMIPSLDIKVEFKGGNLSVKHNGGGFLLKEVIALVSGGTSKYFGRETLGRFGKGFLVTHILSKEVEVESSITHLGTKRPFQIKLDRRGDEKLIEQNINDCKDQLDVVVNRVEPVNLDETTFTYINAAVEEANNCKVLCRPLPYVMIFNPIIENIDVDFELEDGRFNVFWKKRNQNNFDYNGQQFEKIGISTATGELTCIKIKSTKLELAVLLATSGASPEVMDTRCFPSFYCNLPLCDSDSASLSFAINSSSFGIDTNRSFINVSAENSEILEELPTLLNSLLDYLVSAGALNLHLLGHVDFSRLSEERKTYLLKQFFYLTEQLSSKPILRCKNENIAPNSSQIPSGDYLGQNLPKLTPLIYGLLTQCHANVPELYEEWETISKEWAFLGVNLQIRTLENLLESLQADINLVQPGSVKAYVISLIEALYSGQQITKSIPQEISQRKILLNQKLQLVAPQDANIDLQVDEKLKEIASGVGWDIKGQLLDGEILKTLSLKDFISNTLCSGRETFTNDLVLRKLWDSYVSTRWKESQKQVTYKDALMGLIIWLTKNKSSDEIRSFVNPDLLPILCSDGIFRCNEEMSRYPFLWSVEQLEDELRQFVNLIGSRWIMANEYVTLLPPDERTKFFEALSSISVSFETPIFQWSDKQLNEKEADALASSTTFPTGAKVDAWDLIGLQDMTSAVAGGRDADLASKVLAFVLTYVINHDDSWLSPTLIGDKAIYSCYWLAVLKTKDWVPSIDGKHLESLNRESWERVLNIPDLELNGNIVSFLGKHFGINLPGILALKLKVMNPLDYRTMIIDKLITLSSDDASKIAAEVEKRLNDIENVRNNQKLGRIVEEISKRIFEKRGFKTKWTGIGSDFRLVEPDDIGSLKLQSSENSQDSGVLIEVKATAREITRMTMVQAKKAIQTGTRYILCVLDVSGITIPDVKGEEQDPKTVELVAKSLKFVTDVGSKIDEAVKKADGFQDHQGELKDVEIPPGIKIRFEETDIRLGVMKKIWGEGYSLEEIVPYCESIVSTRSTGT